MPGYNNNGNPTYLITALLIRFQGLQELVIFDKVFMMTLLMHVGMKAGILLQGSSQGS